MTRDDAKWTALMVVAVIVGLAALSEGMVRTLGLPLAIVPWLPWCRLVAFVAGIVGAKLGNSPLPGKPADSVSQSTIDKIASSVLLVMIGALLGLAALTMPGCGPKQYHTAVVANTSIAQAIFALQDSEIAAHKAKLVSDVKHAEYKAQILTLLQAGDDLTLALKDWNPSQPVPANVGVAIANVQTLLTDLQVNSPQASALLYTVQTVLSVLRGTGVLPADAALLEVARVGSLRSATPTIEIFALKSGLASEASAEVGPVVCCLRKVRAGEEMSMLAVGLPRLHRGRGHPAKNVFSVPHEV